MKYTGYNDSHYELKIVFDEISNHHWRTNESACQTFAIERKAFSDTKHLLQRQECLDHDQNLYRTMYYSGYPLWTPLLGLTTQVDPYMSPGYDWEKFNSTL